MKISLVLTCLLLCFALSALAQEDSPAFDLQLGLASLDTDCHYSRPDVFELSVDTLQVKLNQDGVS